MVASSAKYSRKSAAVRSIWLPYEIDARGNTMPSRLLVSETRYAPLWLTATRPSPGASWNGSLY